MKLEKKDRLVWMGLFDARTDVQGLAPSTPLKITIQCMFVCSSYTTPLLKKTTHLHKVRRIGGRKVEWMSGKVVEKLEERNKKEIEETKG